MFCCQPPEPSFQPNNDSKKHSSRLKMIMFCEFGVAILLFSAQFFLMGLFELIRCWMLWFAYRSYNFCYLIFYIVLIMFNAFNLLAVIGILIQLKCQGVDPGLTGYGFFSYAVAWIAFCFYLISMYFSFFAYREFKAQEMEAVGQLPDEERGGNYQPPRRDNRDDVRYANYQTYTQPSQSANPPPSSSRSQQPAANQASFPGRGVRLGGNQFQQQNISVYDSKLICSFS
eukprot:TRINITY_DN36856_c0_g1_i1.p1 TRINITY_DN36856_c0_g1~~TRINITY_DN36856_c0_g1_i1.p1  ORF type:complete len:229 (+),score=5.94 TRINITY_DN36856_c0_g1_i1:96-782(+)